MAATYRAMSQSPPAPNLGPIAMSKLAQRRQKSRPTSKSSTEVSFMLQKSTYSKILKHEQLK